MSESEEKDPSEQLEDWKQRYEAGGESPKELFQQITKIALFISYDMIDKIRFYEGETVKMSEDEVDKRIPHISKFLEKLQSAYDEFADVDL